MRNPLASATRLLRALPPRAQLAGAALFLVAFQTALIFGIGEGRVTSIFRLGQAFHQRGPAELLGTTEPYLWRGPEAIGFDGQFFFYLAHDPFLTRGAEDFLDLPRLRARRIAFPMAAWLVAAGGQPALVPWALLLVNAAAFLGAFHLLGRRAREAGLPYATAWTFVFCAATTMVLFVMTGEVVSTFLLFLSMHLWSRGRAGWSLAACFLAILSKEICALWLIALGGHLLWRRRWRLVAGCALVALAYAGWIGYIGWRLDKPAPPPTTLSQTAPAPAPPKPWFEPQKENPGFLDKEWGVLKFRLTYFSAPLAGQWGQLRQAFTQPGGPGLEKCIELGLMLTLTAMALRGLLGLRRRSLDEPEALFFALAGLLVVFLKKDTWDWSGNFARQTFFLAAAALWALPRSRPARADLLAHDGFNLLKMIEYAARILR